MSEVVIYGASDDLVEFEGAINEEFDISYGTSGPSLFELQCPKGDRLWVTAQFCGPLDGEWTVGVVASGSDAPGWHVRFGERPDREGDPAVIVDVPEGTKVVAL